jgi:hypothetical protein
VTADSEALRARRYRSHRAGDHSLCRPDRCRAEGPPAPPPAAGDVGDLAAAVDAEFPSSDPLSRALARRLAALSSGHGPAAVQALRALGELVAAQRAPP